MSLIKEGLKDAIPLIEKFAPAIASLIGGVPGIAASSALSLLNSAFNSNSSDLPGLATKILSDPNVESKLQELNNTHGTWLTYVENLKKLKKAEININLEWDTSTEQK